MRTEVKTGEFYYSKSFRSIAKVIESGTLWGSDYTRIWLPNSGAVVRVPASDLASLSPQSSALSPDHISYVAAAAKVAEVLEGSTSATDGHARAISGDRVRYLLADEVGLGWQKGG